MKIKNFAFLNLKIGSYVLVPVYSDCVTRVAYREFHRMKKLSFNFFQNWKG